MTLLEEKAPYIKEHGDKTICFADTLTQGSNALERKEITEEDAQKLDGGHLMLFGVGNWNTPDLDKFGEGLQAPTNTFERLEIFGCEMREDEQIAFGEKLKPENLQNLKQFDMDNTPLSPQGARSIFEKIAEVGSIEILNLQGSIVGRADVIAAIADALVVDANIYKSLWKLDLKINELKHDGAEHVARLIMRLQASQPETGFCEVDMFYNDIGPIGAQYVFDALMVPTSVVTHFDLCCNQIGDEGANYVASMLRTNRTLKVLKIALNNIGKEGAIEIFKALAPGPDDVNQAQNDTLEILDISANVMREFEVNNLSDQYEEFITARNTLNDQMKQLVDSDGALISGTKEDLESVVAELDDLAFRFNEIMPLVEAISRVCTSSYLKKFDFTGIELGLDCWKSFGSQLVKTSNPRYQKRDNPMKIRFSIVDCMNEQNLKALEKYIWGSTDDISSPYHTHDHIDWRRREEDNTVENTN